jgi:hypothetical protein
MSWQACMQQSCNAYMFDQSVTPMPLQIIPDNIEPLRCTVEIESEIVVLPISSPDD